MFPASILQGTYNQVSVSGADIISLPDSLTYAAELSAYNYIYLTKSQYFGNGLYVSSDGGSTWSVASGSGAGSGYDVSNSAPILELSSTKIGYINNGVINTYTLPGGGLLPIASAINTGISGITSIQYIRQLGSRYYISEDISGAQATYYTTSSALNTGWTSVGTGTASKWIEEGNGAEIYDNGSKLVRSTDGFSTSTDIFGFASSSNVQLLTDGSDNWVRFGIGSNVFRISTDNGVSWTNKYMIEAGGSYPNDIVREAADTGSSFYYNNKFYFLNSNTSNGYTPSKRFYSLPVSEFSSTYPEATVEYDFNISSNTELQGQGYTDITPLYVSKIGTQAFITASDDLGGGSFNYYLFIIDL